MRQDTLAPWAEPVPDAPAAPAGLTANDLLDLPDDGYLYELVEGRLVRMPGSGAKASSIALYLGSRIVMFVRAGKLGLVTDGTGEYNLTLP
jgi:Uma2 family endonuclease